MSPLVNIDQPCSVLEIVETGHYVNKSELDHPSSLISSCFGRRSHRPTREGNVMSRDYRVKTGARRRQPMYGRKLLWYANRPFPLVGEVCLAPKQSRPKATAGRGER